MSGQTAYEGSDGRLSISLFGGFRVRQSSTERDVVVPIKKGQALLAYLARRPSEAHARDKLATLLWGDMAQTLARHSLRQALCVVRASLPPAAAAVIRCGPDNIALDAAGLTVDVVDFERLAADRSIESLERAGALYRGELLDGIAVDEPTFEEWLREEREQLHELALTTFAKLLALQREAGLIESAIQSGLRLLRLDPLQEVVHRTLMRLYASTGRPAAAQRQYEICERLLRDELGVAPEKETELLLGDIFLNGRPSSSLGSTSGSVPSSRAGIRAQASS